MHLVNATYAAMQLEDLLSNKYVKLADFQSSYEQEQKDVGSEAQAVSHDGHCNGIQGAGKEGTADRTVPSAGLVTSGGKVGSAAVARNGVFAVPAQ